VCVASVIGEMHSWSLIKSACVLKHESCVIVVKHAYTFCYGLCSKSSRACEGYNIYTQKQHACVWTFFLQ
jgi:hypothetical protein